MLTIDAHSDLLMDVLHHRRLDEKAVLENRWIPRMRRGGIDLRIAAIYIDNDDLPEQALRKGLDMAATLHQEVEESPSAALCLDSADIRAAREAGKIGFMLSMEGAEPLGSDPLTLKAFHLLGLRLLGLTHSRRNLAADGSRFTGTPPGRPGGVSDIGASFIELAQELKIILDLSHLNDESFWDVLEMTEGPLIASHSNSREVWDIGRNLTDPMIKAVADRGGVIGVNAARLIVGLDHSLEALLTHLDRLYRVGGREAVGLGPDFCDYLVPLTSEVELKQLPAEGAYPVKGLEGDEQIAELPDHLAKRGYSDEDVELIMGRNFMRVIKEVIG